MGAPETLVRRLRSMQTDPSCELVESDPPFLQTLELDCPAELPGGERCLRMFEDHKKTAAGRAGIAHAERRSHPRYACTAATEVVDMGSGARSNGRTADVVSSIVLIP